jgi:DNA (cytosine-5)-methyltransferase 1
MTAYYNENDPEMVAWLRELISRGLLPDGVVDDRSILDVTPYDLQDFTQCHFFAGIGGWPAALKWIVHWPDDRPIWTGSCPCQPFSQAGEGKGFDDERHLWPAFFHLIRVCRPIEVYGEQVANNLAWIDLVQDDMEGEDYTFIAGDLAAASVGAPHIRQRCFWSAHAGEYLAARVAYAESKGLEGGTGHSDRGQTQLGRGVLADSGVLDQLGDAYRSGPQGHAWYVCREEWKSSLGPATSTSIFDQLADSHGTVSQLVEGERARPAATKKLGAHSEFDRCGELLSGRVGADPLHGRWSRADWLLSTDGRFRPVEAGSFPLADGISERVVRLRGYGNAILPDVAAAFVFADQEGLNDVYPCLDT